MMIKDIQKRLDSRLLVPLSFLLFFSLSTTEIVPLKSFLFQHYPSPKPDDSRSSSFFGSWTALSNTDSTRSESDSSEFTQSGELNDGKNKLARSSELTRKGAGLAGVARLEELRKERIAVCLVGGARRFELTGPSIIKNVLEMYENADLYLHAPVDRDSFKFGLLRGVKNRVVIVKVFKPKRMAETEEQKRVLTAHGSPNGIQGLIQYFNLVEGCLTMINEHQTKNNFTYDWIVRTRVDGYWNAPLDPENFVRGQYLVPPGSSYRGLNDRLGIGDLNTSTVALSRLALIPKLQSAGLTELNSETAFKAQLTTQGVPYFTKRLPFCIMSDRKYKFPPSHFGVPVTALSSPGPLSGAKCRPCSPVCQGPCVADIMGTLYKWWSWTDWGNGTLQLCDAHEAWEAGWEGIFDRAAGEQLAVYRKKIKEMKLKECIEDLDEFRKRTINWDAPDVTEICRLGLKTN